MAGVQHVDQDDEYPAHLGIPLTKRRHRMPPSVTDTPVVSDLNTEPSGGQTGPGTPSRRHSVVGRRTGRRVLVAVACAQVVIHASPAVVTLSALIAHRLAVRATV